MKKLFSMAAMLMIAVAAMAQQPVITFEKVEHDFGKINEADGRVTTVFTFKNEGMEALVLSNVRASCGCTTPKWTREPIEPGQTGEITVTYNPSGRPGRFTKTITVTSNATEGTKKLTIKGEVIPKTATPVDMYPVKMGNLSMKLNVADFGTIKKGVNKTVSLEYANKTTAPVTVGLYAGQGSDIFLFNLSMETLEPNQTGQLQILLDEKSTQALFGPFETKIWMIVDGKKELTETYQIVIKGDLQEDFSALTEDQLKKAPISELPEALIDLGTIPAGKAVKHDIVLQNIGTNPLIVRRAVSNFDKIQLTPCKAIKSGKKGVIKMLVSTAGLKPAQYKRELTIITNDPKNPIRKVTVLFTVE